MLQGSIPAWTSVIPEPGMPVFWVTLGPLGSISIPWGEQTPGGHLAAPLLPGGTHLHLPAIACPCKGNSLLRANRVALPFLSFPRLCGERQREHAKPLTTQLLCQFHLASNRINQPHFPDEENEVQKALLFSFFE